MKIKHSIVLTIAVLCVYLPLAAQQNLQSIYNLITPATTTVHTSASATPTNYSPNLSQLFAYEKKCKTFHLSFNKPNATGRVESYPDTLIVGYPPYDTLVITGTFTHTGPIYVANKGLLIIRQANVTNVGDMVVFNNGKVIIDTSTVSFPQSYFYQRSLILVNKATVTVNHSTLKYGGLSHNCVVADTATLTLNNVTQADWTTTGMNNHGTININGTTEAGEFIIEDYVTLNIKHATNAILWHQFPDTANINWSFGKHDTAYGYQFNNTKTGVQGIEYNVNADSVYDVMWSMMPASGSAVNITNSKIRSIGLWFDKPADSVTVSGITDNASYSSFTAPLSDRTLTFSNCSVQTWSFYVFHKSIINVTGCIAGEIGTENSAKMYGNNYLVDGSGGYHWASDTSVIYAGAATVYSYVRSEKSGIFVLAYGNVGGSGGAYAIDNSLLVVVQSLLPYDPTVTPGSTAELNNINQPGALFADSIAPINGSAWIHNGATSNWMKFSNWQLFYHSTDSTNWIPITGLETTEVSNNLLANWNTHSLAAGTYDLDLRITDTWNNKLDAEMPVTLLPLVLGINQLSIFSAISIYPIPTDNQLNVSFASPDHENVQVDICNLIGQKIISRSFTINEGDNLININTSGLSAGAYLCRLISARGVTERLIDVR